MTTSKRNFYDMLGDDCVDANDTDETEKLERKAKKKLREIEKLKKKKHKTPEEYVKIRKESYWEEIATPPEEDVPSKRERDLRSRQEKQIEKIKKEYERKLQKEISMQKKKIMLLEGKVRGYDENKRLFYKTISEQAKTISEQCRKIDELSRGIRPDSSSSIDMVGILKEEMDKLRKEEPTSSPIKLWRKMMLKYHPDKLSSTLGTKMSTEITNVLTNMKPE